MFLLGLAFVALVPAAVTACRDSKRTDGPTTGDTAIVASAAPDAAPSDASADSSASALAEGDQGGRDEIEGDGGRDGGVRKRRRLDASAPDAALDTTTGSRAPVIGDPAPEARLGKSRANPMGDDKPYGGSGASSAPVLQKKPLPGEDPWGNPAPSGSAR